MLNDLQSLFKQSWKAFRTEIARREPEDELADLLGMMRREMVEARASLAEMERAIEGAQAELERERGALADCERRARMAGRIGDTETVRVAEEFAGRHRERTSVLQRKHAAAIAERDLHARDVRQMTQRYRQADTNRYALLAELRRQRAAGTLQDALDGSAGPIGDYSRMEGSIRDSAAYADALGEVADLDAPPPAAERRNEVDTRLEELKRRLGKS